MTQHAFPHGFLWGAATSAQQIEGGYGLDGRSESIWDRYAATPGRIADGSDARVACDHYHRWREDIGLLKWLGLNAYRFSIAWPRVVPGGRGAVNPAGLDFYDALVDALLEAGIRPFVTLYHWDLPQALQDRGGWGERETAEAFVEYADAVTARLGDRVRDWMTHNEPWCVAPLGHESGVHAPGHRDPAEALRAGHHLLLSHGWAAEVVRRNAPGAEVGIALMLSHIEPATDSRVDGEAARRYDGSLNRWYLVRLGHLAGPELPFVRDGDLETIAAPLDFLGVNYYTRTVVRAGPGGEPVGVRMVPEAELTDMGWEVYPQGLHSLLVRLEREYRPRRIHVSENGAAYTDPAVASGRIADTRRVEYLRGHLAAAARAIADGVPLAGYFTWSLLDNFEWGHGYAMRFGLFDVDFATQQRRPRDSAHWYRQVVAANAVDDLAQQPLSRRIP
jgi:beta-glucosidase